MRTWCEVRNFASQKLRLTPGEHMSSKEPVTLFQQTRNPIRL